MGIIVTNHMLSLNPCQRDDLYIAYLYIDYIC